MSLFSVVVEISTNTARFAAGIDQANAKLESFSNTVKGVGTLLSAGAIAGFAEHIIAAGAELEHASVKAGVTSTAFQELAFAARQSGVDSGSLDSALIRMNRSLSLASTGGKQQTDTLRALGLTFTELKNLSPDKQFELLADRISKLASPADRARAEIVLFGRAGGELGDLIMEGANSIEQMRKQAEALGVVMSEQTIKNLEEAHKAIDRLELSFKTLAGTLIGGVAPAITKVLDGIMGLMSIGKGVEFKQLFDFSALAGTMNPLIAALNILRVFRAEAKQAVGDEQTQYDEQAQYLDLRLANLLKGKKPPGYKPETKDTQAWADESMHKLMAEEDFYRHLDDLTKTDLEHTVAAFRKKQVALDELVRAGIISLDEFYTRSQYDLEKVLPEFEVTAKKITEAFDVVHDGIQKFTTDFDNAFISATRQSGSFAKNFLYNLLTALEDKAIFNAIKDIGIALENALTANAASGGWIGAIVSALGWGSFGAGAGGGSSVGGGSWGLVAGGPIQPGMPTLVGESGPELFVSRAGGNIMAAGQFSSSPSFGGDIHIHNNIDARGADAERIMTVLPPLLAQMSARTKRDILYAFERRGIPAPRSA